MRETRRRGQIFGLLHCISTRQFTIVTSYSKYEAHRAENATQCDAMLQDGCRLEIRLYRVRLLSQLIQYGLKFGTNAAVSPDGLPGASAR